MKDLVIFGLGDFARVAHAYLRTDPRFRVVAFTVDERFIDRPEEDGVPVVPFERLAASHPPDRCALFVAIGFSKVNRSRAGVYARSKDLGYELISYVSPHAIVAPGVVLGDNCFVFEANVLQPNVRVGNDVILWSGNHIGHDTTIGDHCFVASHAVLSGNVRIGPYCFVGVNATIRDGVTVAEDCVIGAGALIMKDTLAGGVYAVKGTPPATMRSADLRGL